jgi:hypothetical protein
MRAIVPEFLRSVGENTGRATGDVWNGSDSALVDRRANGRSHPDCRLKLAEPDGLRSANALNRCAIAR